MKFAFFPRNTRQFSLFQNVGKRLSQSGHDIRFIRPQIGASDETHFFAEQVASDLLDSNAINIDKEFTRIAEQYENVNRIIQSDREVNYFPNYFLDKAVTREEKIRLCVAFFVTFEKYIAETKPDIIVSEMVLGMLDGALFEVAKANDIPYLGIRPSKTKKGIAFCDNPFDRPIFLFDEIDSLKEESDVAIKKAAMDCVEESVNPTKLPHYMERSAKQFSLFSLRAVRAAVRLIFNPPKIPKHSIYQHRRLNAFREAFWKHYNIRTARFTEDVDRIVSTGKYFVYAAHFEPEASVQVRSFLYSDQAALIKLLSRCLPPDYHLLVKEHRGNQGFRKAKFYEELTHCYNVECVKPSLNLRSLIQQSSGVITMTGRVGLEALIDDIPVIAFGETFWTGLESVHKPRSPEDLIQVIRQIISSDYDRSIGKGVEKDADLCRLIVAYENLTFQGNFVQGSDFFVSQENAQQYADALLSIIARLGEPQLG